MEDEIYDLRKFIWDIILSWRALLICSILMGIALSGIKYYKDYKAYNNAVSSSDNAVNSAEKIKVSLNDDALAEVKTITSVYEQIREQQDYLENNVLMKVDPYNEKVIKLQYYVKLKNISDIAKGTSITDNNTSIAVYSNNLANIYAGFSAEEDAVNLILKNSSNDLSKQDVPSLISTDFGANYGVFTINIICVEGMDAQAIAQGIDELLHSKSAETQKVAENELISTSSSVTTQIDKELILSKNTSYTQLTSMNTNVLNMESKLSDEQKAYLAIVKSEIFGEETNQDNEKNNDAISIVKPSVSFKYVIVGILIGIAFVCCIVFAKTILTAKLSSIDELVARQNIVILGTVGESENKKRFLGFIDKCLINIRDRNRKHLTYEQKIEGLVTGIALCCQQKKLNKIVLSGTEIENVDKKIIDDIIHALVSQNINVDVVNDICYDATALQKAVDTGNLVAVEQIGVSIKEEIDNEINKAKEYDIDILGAVVIE